MNTIREIVNELKIKDKKYQQEENRRKILEIKQIMSEMRAENDKVAQYADDIEMIEFYRKYFYNFTKEQQEHAIKEVNRLRNEVRRLKTDFDVLDYEKLNRELIRLKTEEDEYYKTIQVDLRRELLDQPLPKIYLYQGSIVLDNNRYQMASHIIIPGRIKMIGELEPRDTMIYPSEEVASNPDRVVSNRNLKRFYNRTSFNYLEQLTEDYEYSLDGKHLGKVKILRR